MTALGKARPNAFRAPADNVRVVAPIAPLLLRGSEVTLPYSKRRPWIRVLSCPKRNNAIVMLIKTKQIWLEAYQKAKLTICHAMKRGFAMLNSTRRMDENAVAEKRRGPGEG